MKPLIMNMKRQNMIKVMKGQYRTNSSYLGKLKIALSVLFYVLCGVHLIAGVNNVNVWSNGRPD